MNPAACFLPVPVRPAPGSVVASWTSFGATGPGTLRLQDAMRATAGAPRHLGKGVISQRLPFLAVEFFVSLHHSGRIFTNGDDPETVVDQRPGDRVQH